MERRIALEQAAGVQGNRRTFLRVLGLRLDPAAADKPLSSYKGGGLRPRPMPQAARAVELASQGCYPAKSLSTAS